MKKLISALVVSVGLLGACGCVQAAPEAAFVAEPVSDTVTSSPPVVFDKVPVMETATSPKTLDCNPAGYLNRKVLKPGQAKAVGSSDISPDDFKKGTLRVLKPGDAATMDFSAQRLNLTIDPQSNIVIDVSCG